MSRAIHKVFVCEISKYVHALFTGSYYDIWRRIMRLYYNEIYLSDNPPSPGKAGHTNGVYVLYSVSEQWCRFFVTSHNSLPYPWSLESLTFFAYVITKAALSSQLLKDPECWSSRGLNPRSPNWANQAVVKSTEILLLPFTFNHSESTDPLDFKNTWPFEESPINLCSQFKPLGSGKIQVFTQY